MEKRNTPTLFVGREVGAATRENSMEVPQKTKNTITTYPAIPLLGIYWDKTIIQKDTCLKWITNKDLPYSIENSAQYYVTT